MTMISLDPQFLALMKSLVVGTAEVKVGYLSQTGKEEARLKNAGFALLLGRY
jgi:hypothetical protein